MSTTVRPGDQPPFDDQPHWRGRAVDNGTSATLIPDSHTFIGDIVATVRLLAEHLPVDAIVSLATSLPRCDHWQLISRSGPLEAWGRRTRDGHLDLRAGAPANDPITEPAPAKSASTAPATTRVHWSSLVEDSHTLPDGGKVMSVTDAADGLSCQVAYDGQDDTYPRVSLHADQDGMVEVLAPARTEQL